MFPKVIVTKRWVFPVFSEQVVSEGQRIAVCFLNCLLICCLRATFYDTLVKCQFPIKCISVIHNVFFFSLKLRNLKFLLLTKHYNDCQSSEQCFYFQSIIERQYLNYSVFFFFFQKFQKLCLNLASITIMMTQKKGYQKFKDTCVLSSSERTNAPSALILSPPDMRRLWREEDTFL